LTHTAQLAVPASTGIREASQGLLTFTGNDVIPAFSSETAIGASRPLLDLLVKFKSKESDFGDDSSLGVYVVVHWNGRPPEGESLHGYFGGNAGTIGGLAVLCFPFNSVRVASLSSSPITISQVPEPGAFLSMAMGLATLALARSGRRA
jgi:hypothetical protein